MAGAPAVPLASTYAHLDLPNGFQYRFIDECVIDTAVFGTDDPRLVAGLDPETCPVCQQRQSDEIEKNQCSCFPTLFGGIRGPVPVQLFRTINGKNNGVVARTVRLPSPFPPPKPNQPPALTSSLNIDPRPRAPHRRIHRAHHARHHRRRRNARRLAQDAQLPDLPRSDGQLHAVHQPQLSTE